MKQTKNRDYKVRLDTFEGPLDLLLYLVKQQEINLHEISIENIASQYLQYMKNAKELNLELTSEFVVMASHLLYLKSRSLLPAPELSPEEDLDSPDPRWELIRQLIEYKKFKDVAEVLHLKKLQQQERFPNRPETKEKADCTKITLEDSSVSQLIESFQFVLEKHKEKPELRQIIDDPFTVADKIDSLLESLPQGNELQFESFFLNDQSRSEAITTFLALLELIRTHHFSITQHTNLGTITIRRLPTPAPLAHAQN